ncbi:hypothetical protein GLYMA_03G121350v4 [Glycine max]|nr:hypothetical protein GLYMA_03G121350v4 [Glycine max]
MCYCPKIFPALFFSFFFFSNCSSSCFILCWTSVGTLLQAFTWASNQVSLKPINNTSLNPFITINTHHCHFCSTLINLFTMSPSWIIFLSNILRSIWSG